MKIAIIGYSGSGKSTLAKQIASRIPTPILHLDTIHFTANWQKRNRLEAQRIEANFRQQQNWIIEGNFQHLNQNDRFQEADQIIFLDYNRFLCLFQAAYRFWLNRGKQRDDLAKGSYDRWTFSFLWWILWEGRRPKWKIFYLHLAQQFPDKFIRLQNHRQAKEYLSTLTATKSI